jgi:phosphoglycolate phosphatase
MPIAAVLFDKDGTLIDFDSTWGPAIHAVMQTLARGDAAAMRAQAEALHFSLLEKRFRATSPIIAGSSAHYAALWGAALGRADHAALREEIDRLSARESLNSLTPIGEPREVFAELRARGLRLGVATNDSEAGARRHVEALGLSPFVEFIAGYDSGHGGKPAPGMVLAFARSLGLSADRLAVVGDSRHDLEAAQAAGALAIGVLSGLASRDDLAPRADHIIPNIAALPALLARLAVAPGRGAVSRPAGP